MALVKMGKPVSEVPEELGIGSGGLYGWLRTETQPAQVGGACQRAEGKEAEATNCAGCAAKMPTSTLLIS